MKFQVETITPQDARKMLDRTSALGFTNRSLSRPRTEKLAHAIVTGQWRVTHQGLAIGKDGAVLDGQHRLAAIIAADTAVDMLVCRDADPADFGVIDTGTARTTADTLRIAGFTNQNVLAAMVRGYLACQEVIGTTDSLEKRARLVTTEDVLIFLNDQKRQDVARACQYASTSVATGLARYGVSSSIGIVMMLSRLRQNELGGDAVAEFFARLSDGTMLAPSSPILALRRWIMADTGYARLSGTWRRTICIAATIKCLNDYALGRERLVVAFKAGIEPFPAPLPRGSRRKLERELAERETASV